MHNHGSTLQDAPRRGWPLSTALVAVASIALLPLVAVADTYSFGRSSFTKDMWIKDGELFKDVQSVEVEMINNGAFKLEVIDPSGKIISERTDKTGSGWHTFNFSSGMGPPPGAGPYKLRFVNVDPGERQIKSGNVNGKYP